MKENIRKDRPSHSQKIFMQKYILPLILILWVFSHILFFGYNTILTEADSFAYIRMAEWLLWLTSDGLGTGWFWFIYSTFLALFLPFFSSDIFAGQVANMFLLLISSLIFYHLCLKILSKNWSLFALIIFLFHPSFLYYRIHLLAENIYILVFLGIVLLVWNYINLIWENKEIEVKNKLLRENITLKNIYVFPFFLWILLGLLYLTRAEWFIYIGSIGIIAIYLLIKRHLSWKQFLISGSIFFLSFFIFVSPYLYHLQTITGEWWLTNKWASNWRQAELRGQEKMDDLWFEEAVAGLTNDKTSLISGFAGGMPYFRPQIQGSFIDALWNDPLSHFSRVAENQKKLFLKNLPEIYFWKSYNLFKSDDTRFHWVLFELFLLWLIVPFFIGIVLSYRKYSQFLLVFFSFFLPASLFFTLFFTLNRYFIIFLPFFIIFLSLWVQSLSEYVSKRYPSLKNAVVSIFLILFTLNTLLSNYNFLSLEREKNEFYKLKKEAWEWLASYDISSDKKILERFPFVTYYSKAKWRYITPYSENIEDIMIYMKYNTIQYLIIDSMDFYTYRPALRKYLDEIPEGFELLREFTNSKDQKVKIVSVLEK